MKNYIFGRNRAKAPDIYRLGRLRNKLSGAVMSAVQECDKVDTDTGAYYLNSDNYHEPIENGGKDYCMICLAGGLIARIVQDPDVTVDLYQNLDKETSFYKHDCNKLWAIDAFRKGDVEKAIGLWYGDDAVDKDKAKQLRLLGHCSEICFDGVEEWKLARPVIMTRADTYRQLGY